MRSVSDVDTVASSSYYDCHGQSSTISHCLCDLPPPNVDSICSSCRSRRSTSDCRLRQHSCWDPPLLCISLWATTVYRLVLHTDESRRGAISVGCHGCLLWPRWRASLRRLLLLGIFHICECNASAVVSLLWFIAHLIMQGCPWGTEVGLWQPCCMWWTDVSNRLAVCSFIVSSTYEA